MKRIIYLFLTLLCLVSLFSCSQGGDGAVPSVENAALGECICAERTAVCKAVSEGVRSFRRLAVFAEGDSYCLPCGSCRQVLSEFAPDIELLCVRGDGAYVSYPLRALLPHPFKLN